MHPAATYILPSSTTRYDLANLPGDLSDNYATLSNSFIDALKTWKPQTVSFLEFPAEIRNHVYRLIILGSDKYYTELVDVASEGRSRKLSPVALAFTCTRIRKEILPMYFRAINLRLHYHDKIFQAQRREPENIRRAIDLYRKLDPTITDHLRIIKLGALCLSCNIIVNDSNAVNVQLATFYSIKPAALKYMSIAIRNKIIDSLATSPTGLLGIRHFAIALDAIRQIWGWCEWKREQTEWARRKFGEAPWHNYRSWDMRYHDYHQKYLLKEAQEEGLPKLIKAASSQYEADTLSQCDFLDF